MSEPRGELTPFRGETELNAAEMRLLDHAARGEDVDLSGEAVRGSIIREALCGAQTEGTAIPGTGLKILNAVVTGGLDLEGCRLTRPLIFERSLIEGDDQGRGLILRDARIKWIGLHTTVIEGDIIAERIHVENGMLVSNGEVRGAVVLSGGDFSGTFSFQESRLGDGARGFVADGIHARGTLNLRRSKLNGNIVLSRARLDAGIDATETEILSTGAEWGIDASAAHLGGDFLLEGARIDGALGISHAEISGRLNADGLKLKSGREVALAASGVNIAHGISARYATIRGTMDLQSARIDKGIASPGLEISGGETAIIADVSKIGGNWDLAGSKLIGDFTLAGARIAGQLKLTGARLYGSQVAVRADGARIDGGCFMSRAIIIGLLRFPAVYIGNQFRLRGASLKVDYGPALMASGSVFCRDVELTGGIISAGALVFDQSEIRGTLDLSQSSLSSAALSRVGGVSIPDEKKIGGLEQEQDQMALSLVDARINRVLMPDREDHRPRGNVVLSRAHVGAYHDFATTWPTHFDGRARSAEGRDIDHLVLDGFTYDHLSNPSGAQSVPGEHSTADDRVGSQRLMWLAGQEACEIQDHFKPQPWVQLSTRLAAQGYLDDARQISIARQRLALNSHSTSFAQRWQGRILDHFALFGHNPWRTMLWMAFFIVMFAGLWAMAASSCQQSGCLDESVYSLTNRDAYSSDKFAKTYPPFNALGYSLDVFVPFISFGYADHWRPNVNWEPITKLSFPSTGESPVHMNEGTPSTSEQRLTNGNPTENWSAGIHVTRGGLLYVLMVLEMILGLTLTSLAVTGFTGLLRSD